MPRTAEEMLNFCKAVLAHVEHNPKLSEEEKENMIGHLLYTKGDPHMFLDRDGNGDVVFLLKVDSEYTVIRDMNIYTAVAYAFEESEYKDNVVQKLRTYNKVMELNESKQICNFSDILETCRSYKYNLIASDHDLLHEAVSQQKENPVSMRLLAFYEHLKNNNCMVFGKYAMRTGFGEILDTKGVKDFRITYVKDNSIFAKDLPCVNIFKGFMDEVKYNDRKRCLICFEKKFKKILECGNCKKRTCQPCFEKIKGVTCSFCRYHIHDHLQKQIDSLALGDVVLNIREIKIINPMQL